MIKKILPPEECAKCKGCCFFDSADIWEVPYILPELAQYIKENHQSVELAKTGDGYKFKLPDKLSENKLFVCPMLSESGCVLGDNKPFDCRIYPFRVMKDKSGADRIAVSNYCKSISEVQTEKLKEFLTSSGLYEKIIAYKNNNPFIVIDYTDDYTIIY